MFRVKCPICKGLLTIDPRTRKVVSHRSVEEAGQNSEQRFESIVKNLEKSKAGRAERMEAAKAREAGRKEQLDDLFDKASQKAKENPDEGRPLGPVWD